MDIEQAKAHLRELVPEFAETVQPIYELLGWEWRTEDKPFIPSVGTIMECLYGLIDGLEEPPERCGTGGLSVEIQPANEFDACDNFILEFKLQHTYIQGEGGHSTSKNPRRQT